MAIGDTERLADDPLSGKFYARLLDSSLLKRSRTASIEAEVCRLIRSEMFAAGTPEPPVKLRRLGAHLGVSNIVAAPLAVRGRIVIKDAQLIVEVNEELDDLTQRITTAHELAHIILERERISLARAANANVRDDVSHRLIERLCDYGSNEILLPRWWVEEQLLQRGQQFTTAVTLSEMSRLPLEFVVARLINLQFVPWRAIWCQRAGAQVRVASSVPHWDDLFLAGVEVVDATDSPLTLCWGSETPTPGMLTLRIQGEASRFRAQCFKKDSDTAICVIYTARC